MKVLGFEATLRTQASAVRIATWNINNVNNINRQLPLLMACHHV